MNKPLIAHTIEQALQSNLFQEVIVSTDSQEYADIALQHGASVPFLRPAKLASSEIPTSAVTLHILHYLQAQGKHYEYFSVLQPTSPLKTPQDLQKSFELLVEKQADIIISVTQAHHPIEWANTLPENLSMDNFISEEARDKPRQQLPPRYIIHGAIFWGRTSVYLKNQNAYTSNSYAYIMPEERSVDIDTITDFHLAEILYKQQHNL